MIDEKLIITKEQALEIAKIENNLIHCFMNPSFGLIGADWNKKT